MVEPLTPRVVAICSSPEPASAAKRICARLSLRAACRPPLKSAVSSSCSDWLRSTRYRTFIRASWRSKPEMNLQMNQIFGENAPASQRRFTTTQGQYLAFIYAYTRVLGRPPAEADMQRHFKVTAPTVHQMVLTLERNGLVKRQPGVARSIQLLVPPEALQSYVDT